MFRSLTLLFGTLWVLSGCGRAAANKDAYINRAPEWLSDPFYLPISCVWKEFRYNLNLNTTDIEGDALTYELPSPPFADISITEQGALNFFPAEYLLGDYVFEIVVFDGRNRTSTQAHLRIDECRD